MFDNNRRFERTGKDSGNTGLALAPMIDVVFLLLIFFMVSTTFVTRPGLKLDLPEAESRANTPSERWVVSIASNGQLYLNNDKIRLGNLQSKLSKNPKPVLIRADETVSHGIVVTILDNIKTAGITSVNLSTEPIQTSGDKTE